MTGIAGRADIALDINNFMVLLWEDIEHNEGQGVTDFFTEDGVFDSKMVCFNGHQEIRDWFNWRRGMIRTARHLLNNIYYDFSKWETDQEVTMRAIMTHYGETGKGVLPVGPPIGVYDHKMRVRRGGKHGWSILHLVNDPVFLAEDHVAKSYKVKKIA